MKSVRACLAGVALLAATGAWAQQNLQATSQPANLSAGEQQEYQQYQARLRAAEKLPAALKDMPFIAGIDGNDAVHANTLRRIVSKQVSARDFAALDELEAYFRTQRSRLPNGGWELSVFHGAVEAAVNRGDEPGRCELHGDLVNEWAAREPAKPEPKIIAAELLVDLAWCLRGEGTGDTVSPEGWAGFRKYIDAAQATLTAHADIVKQDPEYYALMEKIYQAQARTRAEYRKLLDEASAAEPYYYDIYYNAADHALPQWGGSGKEVDAIARYAMERTKARDGAGAYARVYSYLDNCGCDVSEFPVDHALLARAMDDLAERTPSNWGLAKLTRLACHVGDPVLTAKQFARRASDDGAEWGNKAEWQRCRAFAGLPSGGSAASAPPIAAR